MLHHRASFGKVGTMSPNESSQVNAQDDGTVQPSYRPPPSRQGKKSIVIYVDRDYHKELRLLAVRRDTSLQALGEEAFRMVVAKYGATG